MAESLLATTLPLVERAQGNLEVQDSVRVVVRAVEGVSCSGQNVGEGSGSPEEC